MRQPTYGQLQMLLAHDLMPLDAIVHIDDAMRREHPTEAMGRLVVMVKGVPVAFHHGFEVIN